MGGLIPFWFRGLCTLNCLVASLTIAPVLADEVKDDNTGKNYFFHPPNPFANAEQKGFYYIKSHQTVITREIKRTTLEVDEYFSLNKGISYSVYRNVATKGEYAIVSDGKADRSYIIRNPSENDEEKLICELDAVHHHRQVFPWQFVYDLSPTSVAPDTANAGDGDSSLKRRRKKKKKSLWGSKRYVYGVGAIWLNAIELNVVSDKVGDKSPYATSQPWTMNNRDLTVELLFEKPEGPIGGYTDMLVAISTTKLLTVHIRRNLGIILESDLEGTAVGVSANELIEIDEFLKDLDPTDDGPKRVARHLKHCRAANKEHSVFPSLLRAMSLSASHMYELDYLETRFGEVEVARSENSFRKVHNPELVYELFSIPYETQVTDYQGILNVTSGLYDGRVDSFIKKFTERASGLRSTRHSTAYYHIVKEDEEEDRCMNNERDPPPDWFPLLSRPFRFMRPNDVQLTGILTGLGALLMNANDIHYKQFSLLQKEIDVLYDVANINSRMKVAVDEWRLEDRSRKRVHFYFKQAENIRGKYDISSLVRVEVRKMTMAPDDSVIQDAIEDDLNDSDLMIRWDVMGVHTENTRDLLEYFFTTPDICTHVPSQPDSVLPIEEDSDKIKEIDEFATQPPFHIPEDDESTDDFTNPEEEEEPLEDAEQKWGEDLEMEPGMMNEGIQIPDFFEFFEGTRIAYTSLSKVELISDDVKSKIIYIKENVNLGVNIARISVFFDDYSERAEPELDYYFNYDSELLLKVKGKSCVVDQPVETWLRLFSVDLPYWRTNEEHDVTEESHNLRLYGVGALWRYASISGIANYIGTSRQVIEEKGSRYKRLYWDSLHDNDPYMDLRISFLYNISEEERGLDRSGPLFSLSSIVFDHSDLDPNHESLFDRVMVSVLKFQRNSSPQVYIPDSCESTLKGLSISRADLRSSLPTFDQFLGDKTGYTAFYYVTKVVSSKDHKVHIEQITESYNIKTYRGKITIGTGQETKEVFIDWSNKCIYLFADHKCKLLTEIKAFETGLDLFDYNDRSSSNCLYGIANIWRAVGSLKSPVVKRTVYEYDRYGNHIRRSTYELTTEVKSKMVTVKLSFTLGKTDDALDLNEIEINEALSTKASSIKLSRTRIEILGINRWSEQSENWDLPDGCAGLCPRGTSDDQEYNPPVASAFPDLTKILAPLGKFYMRSEVVFPEAMKMDPKSKSYYLMDEWYKDGDYRIKSYGLNKNFDEIIYTTSDEHFDISDRNLCKVNHILPEDKISTNESAPLLGLWKGGKQMPNSLNDLHYGPVSIWRLAEANKDSLELIGSINLTPSDEPIHQSIDSLQLEMVTRVWRLTHPSKSWWVDLRFLVHSSDKENDDERIEWLVLDGITVTQNTDSGNYAIEVDIVNYAYRKDDDEMRRRLLLPEGYGCRRSVTMLESMTSVLESIQLLQPFSYYVRYETTLEKLVRLDDDYGSASFEKTRTVLPSVSGTFYRIAQWMSPNVSIWASFNTIRYSNGTAQSTKVVHDVLNNLYYNIDRTTGFCKMSVTRQKWKITYPSELEGTEEVLEMDDTLFDRLFMKSEKYQPLNRYEKDGIVYITYEESGSYMSLTKTLAGPYSIVRRFEFNKALTPYRVKLFNSVIVKVYIFDSGRVHAKAILTFNMRRAANVALNQIIETFDVSTCYNNGVEAFENPARNFAIEYACENRGTAKTFSESALRTTFFLSLLEETKIYPTQLSEPPRLESSQDGVFQFQFKLIEPPTFILTDSARYFGVRMSPNYESVAHVKAVPTITDCSRLCDKTNCVGLAYCSNRLCYTVTKDDVTYSKSLKLGVSPVIDSNCEFHIKASSSSTLDQLDKLMDEINSIGTGANRFPLKTGNYCGIMYPNRLTEVEANSEKSQGSTGVQKHSLKDQYTVSAQNRTLMVQKLDQLQDKGFKYSLESVEDQASCLKHCEVQNCVMISFCKTSLDACAVVTGSGDIKELEGAIGEEIREDCTVMARDFTVEFTRFSNTRKPSSSSVQYTGYSDIECAAACVLSNSNRKCLSFDHCLINSSEGDHQSVCFIQTIHMYSMEFEKTIFENTKKTNTSGGENNFCQHYSRSFLADYQKIPNRRLKDEATETEQATEPDDCAYRCHNEDDCYAFVHCYTESRQTCRLLRRTEESKFSGKTEALNYLNQESRESNTCSMYVREQVEDYPVQEEASNSRPSEMNLDSDFWKPFTLGDARGLILRVDEEFSLIGFLFRVGLYLHVAVLVGIIIQIVMLRSRSLF